MDTQAETPDRNTHPYASLVDAIQAELRPYYSAEWSRERANNLAQACGEPDVRLSDIVQMLRPSGERPAPWDAVEQRPLDRHQICQCGGNVLAAALSQINRRLRLEAL